VSGLRAAARKPDTLRGLLLTASGPFLPVFWKHTSDLHLPLGDAVHEWLAVSSFSGLAFAVLLLFIIIIH
jgi:hypothetical protein